MRVRGPDRREELLVAARRAIGRSGFASVTVGEITREAGASLGLLHYHFASKDEVVAEAFAEVAREELAELADISRRHADPADRLAEYLALSSWADAGSWRLWVDAWGGAVHTEALRDTLGRFVLGWRAVLAEVLADGARQGRWRCDDPADLAARLVAAFDGIGLHCAIHGEILPPERATAWARRLAELELGAALPDAPAAAPAAPAPPAHEALVAIRARDLDPRGHVEHLALLAYLEEARAGWLGGLDVHVAHVAVDVRRPISRRHGHVVARCGLEAAAGASLRTRETIETERGALVATATATLEPLDAAGRPRPLTGDERAALAGAR